MRESFTVDLRNFGSLLRTRKWTIIAVIATVVGAALLLSLRQAPVYVSSASVLVEVPSEQTPQQGPNMATEKQVASSAAVAKIVLAKLHLPGEPGELLRGLSVEVPVDTEILNLSYSAREPEVAQQRSETFAQAYLAYRQQKLGDDVLAIQRSLQDQISSLNGRLNALQKRAAAQTSERDRAILTAQANLLYTQISNLYLKQAELVRVQQAPPGRILADAVVPVRPSRPNHLVNGSLGLLLGLILGIGAAILREHADDHIRGSQDFESQVGATVLGAIPAVPALRGPASEELVTIRRSDSPAAEAFRHLRANFVVAAAASGAKTVLVTSPGEGEGKTFTTANLGVVLAKAGKCVILLSGDVRRPRLEQVFELSARRGLADILVSGTSVSETLQDAWSVTNLMVLPMGSTDGDPTELLGSKDMAKLIQDLRHRADFVLIDAAPLLPVADAAAVVPTCDAVLLVADASSATRANVFEACRKLERMHATMLGAVLVNARDNGLKPHPQIRLNQSVNGSATKRDGEPGG